MFVKQVCYFVAVFVVLVFYIY